MDMRDLWLETLRGKPVKTEADLWLQRKLEEETEEGGGDDSDDESESDSGSDDGNGEEEEKETPQYISSATGEVKSEKDEYPLFVAKRTLTDVIADSMKKPPKEAESSITGGNDGDNNWTMGVDYYTAAEWLVTGMPTIPKEFSKALPLAQRVVTDSLADVLPRRCLAIDEEGDEILIDRALEGEDRCFLEVSGRRKRDRPIVTLVTTGLCNCNVSAETYYKLGSVVYSLAEALESNGYGVRIIVAAYGVPSYSATQPNYRTLQAVIVKEANDYVLASRLAFVMAHPSFGRRIMFRMLELMPKEVREGMGVRNMGGYGRSQPITDELLSFALDIKNAVILPSAENYGSSCNIQKMTLDCIESLRQAKAIEESTIQLAA